MSEGKHVVPHLHPQRPHSRLLEIKLVCPHWTLCAPTGPSIGLHPCSVTVGTVAAKALRAGSCYWERKKKGARFTPAETSALLYKHKMGSPESPLPKQTSVLFLHPGCSRPLCLNGLELPACSSQAPPNLPRSWKILETPAIRATSLPFTEKQGGGK